jgi:hypothetical protein
LYLDITSTFSFPACISLSFVFGIHEEQSIMAFDANVLDVLNSIVDTLKSLQKDNAHLASSIDEINGRVNTLATIKQFRDGASISTSSSSGVTTNGSNASTTASKLIEGEEAQNSRPSSGLGQVAEQYEKTPTSLSEVPPPSPRRSSLTYKTILTSYPGQAGVNPIAMNWGAKDPNVRGPVVVSRHANTIRRRNGKTMSFYFCPSSLSNLTIDIHGCNKLIYV